MKKYVTLFVLIAMSFLLGSCSQPSASEKVGDEKTTKITVAAAASLTDVMEEITEMYQKKNPKVNIALTFGSSGSLRAQIEEGAPVDVFLSAAEKHMDLLEEKGMIKKNSRKDLLLNQIVLITPKNGEKEIRGFDDISTEEVEKIALGEPKSVPAGQYSQEVIQYLGMEKALDGKIVEATDVRQALSWVEMGEVDCGMVYSTDAKTSDRITVVEEAPKDSHALIAYPAALVEDTEYPEASQEFLDFLSTKEVQEIFEEYGFTTL